MDKKVIALIDVDCFYCQVETKLNPQLKGKPVAVVQHNSWKGGGIIAVNYEARSFGVTRHMRGDDARKFCPEIELVSVPDIRGKADLSKYRNASIEIMSILCEFCPCVEKASIDEAYLDLTDVISKKTKETVTSENLKSTYIIGYSPNRYGTEQWLSDIYANDTIVNVHNLASTALLVEEIRDAILYRTGFHCSAGISHNKILAKLACGLHKPKCQTVLPFQSVPILYEKLPLKKIKNLGGKFGEMVKNRLNITTIGEIFKFGLQDLQQIFGNKSGSWLYNISRGIDLEPVKSRTVSKSLGCCKNFKGISALTTKTDIEYWLKELCMEIHDRVQEDFSLNKRKATLLTLSLHQRTNNSNAISRSIFLNNYNLEEIINKSFQLVSQLDGTASRDLPVEFIGISVSKFVSIFNSTKSLLNFFKPLHSIGSDEKKKIDSSAQPLVKYSIDSKTLNSFNILINDNRTDLKFSHNNSTVNNFQNLNLDYSKSLNYTSSFFCKYFKKRKLCNISTNNLTNITKNTYECISDTNKQISAVNLKEINSQTDFSEQFKNMVKKNKNCDSDCFCIEEKNLNDVNKNKSYDLNHDQVIEMETLSSCDNKIVMTEYCKLCNQQIIPKYFLEHRDYHFAYKLNQELNNTTDTKSDKIYSSSTDGPFSEYVATNTHKKQKENRPNSIDKNQFITSFFQMKQE
ncbi:hypothetical protein PGB90_005393 [Kerria lacca]